MNGDITILVRLQKEYIKRIIFVLKKYLMKRRILALDREDKLEILCCEILNIYSSLATQDKGC